MSFWQLICLILVGGVVAEMLIVAWRRRGD